MCWIKLSRGGGGVRVMGQELLSRPLADILHGSRLVFNNKNHSTLQFCISHCGTVLVVWDYKWPTSTPTSSRGEGSSLLHHKMKSSWKVPFSKKEAISKWNPNCIGLNVQSCNARFAILWENDFLRQRPISHRCVIDFTSNHWNSIYVRFSCSFQSDSIVSF